MKNHATITLLLLLTFFSSVNAFAQEKPVVTLLKSYIQATNELGESQDAETVLSLFSKNYQNNTAYIGMSGVLNRTTTTYAQLEEKLGEDIKNRNYNFTMSLTETVHESQKENAGTASALINFESKIEGKVAEKGAILMNIVATKEKGEWKITHNNTVRVSEESEIGNCVCYLFSKGESYFNAETYYPAGLKYDREYKSYRVGTKDGKRAIVNRGNNNRTFFWNQNGEILDGSRKIGSAETSVEAIQIVLAFVYSSTCTDMSFS
ncbi:MAG: hypothetical protein AAFP76_10600 [Bacteroidota bacterium]